MFTQEKCYENRNNAMLHEVNAFKISKTILDISQVSIDFASIERVPRYYAHKRENNAEHSFMLGLATMEIGKKYYPELDRGLMTEFALVHDLVELKTMDIPTFNASDEVLASKEVNEQKAAVELAAELPPYLGSLLLRYELQNEKESRLVRNIDKLLPYAVDIRGSGKQVMREDYDTHSAEQLLEQHEKLQTRFGNMFPEPSHDILQSAHDILGNSFALTY